MKINKKLQYGLLFTFYLARSGRSTVSIAAQNLTLSKSFLTQVAKQLRAANIITAHRGLYGGYELSDKETTVKDIIVALDIPYLLSRGEEVVYSKGPSEYKTLVLLATNLNLSMAVWLRKKVRTLGSEMMISANGCSKVLN